MVSLYSFYTADHLDGVQGTDRADLYVDRSGDRNNKQTTAHSLSFFFFFFIIFFFFGLIFV